MSSLITIFLCLVLSVSLFGGVQREANQPWSKAVETIDKHLSKEDSTALKFYISGRKDSWAYGKGQKVNDKLSKWAIEKFSLNKESDLKAYFKKHAITKDYLISSFLIAAWYAQSTNTDFDIAEKLQTYAWVEKEAKKALGN